MPDEKLDIGIDVTAQTAGAQQAERALEGVKMAAQDAGKAISEIPAAAPQFDLDPGKMAEIKDQLLGLSRDFKAIGESADNAVPKFRSLQQILGGVTTAARGGPEAFGGLARAMEGIGKASGLAVGQISLFTGALAVGVKLGYELTPLLWALADSIKEIFSDIPAIATIARAELEQLNKVDLDFDSLKKGTAAAIKTLDTMIERVRTARDTSIERRGAETSAEVKGLEVERRRALLQAGVDENLKRAINYIYDEKIFSLRLAQEERKIASDISKAEQERELLARKHGQIQKQLLDATTKADEAMQRYERILKELGDSALDTKRLLRSPEYREKAAEAVRAEIETARRIGATAEIDRLGRIEYLLTELPGALAAAATAKETAVQLTNESLAALSEVATRIREATDAIAGLAAKRVEIGRERELQSLEFGAESTAALKGLEQAIREQSRKVEEARLGVAAAQAGGGAAEQTAAQARLRVETDLLADLQAKYDSAANQIASLSSSLGQAYVDGAKSIAARSDEAKQIMTDAAAAVMEGATVAAHDLKQSADIATRATSDAMGTIVGQINSWGQQTVQAFTRVNDALLSLVADMSSVRAQLNITAANADLALRQIQNTR